MEVKESRRARAAVPDALVTPHITGLVTGEANALRL
jgi:hypothetical protein